MRMQCGGIDAKPSPLGATISVRRSLRPKVGLARKCDPCQEARKTAADSNFKHGGRYMMRWEPRPGMSRKEYYADLRVAAGPTHAGFTAGGRWVGGDIPLSGAAAAEGACWIVRRAVRSCR